MFYYIITPKSLPKIKFAHYFVKKNHSQIYYKSKPDIEIVYVKNGYLDVEVDGKSLRVPEESIFIYARHYRANLIAEKGIIHMHYTADIILDYDCEIVKDNIEQTEENSIIVPFFISKTPENEHLFDNFVEIVNKHNFRNENDISCDIALLGLLGEISIYNKTNSLNKKIVSSSVLCLKVKKYISEHLSDKIELNDIATLCEKTPNYVNSVFKNTTGITIGKYIAKEKVNMIAELKKTKDITFEEACLSVGIEDVSYGYRLFKKYMGVTPKKYFSVALNESAWILENSKKDKCISNR